MSLRAALIRILTEYREANQQRFADNPLATFVRKDFRNAISDAVGENPRYSTKGSPGQGNWADVPWGTIFDRLITETAQEGYYLVYLFRQDATGVYLSLNQGVTSVRKQYRANTKRALRARAIDFLARIGEVDASLIIGPIDLRTTDKQGLGADYEEGAICSLFYDSEDVPTDEVLLSDLRLFLDYYFALVTKEAALFDYSEQEEDEEQMHWEDLSLFRLHKRVERNRRLARNVKRQLGLNCQACGFNFRRVYGDIGKTYIEAHHLTPVAELRGKRVALNPRRDFSVLCANCHRMIHRSLFVSDVEAFRKIVLKKQ